MSIDLRAGIVRILGPDDETTVGTGFVVSSDGYIATCAHVIDAANVGPGEKVSFIWHATKKKEQAIVDIAYWREANGQDIAVLRLVKGEKLPDGVISLPIGSSLNTQGQILASFGFPESKPVDGLWGESKILGSSTEGNIPVLQGSSFQVSKGFSGAPVWDATREAVVGMVRSIIGYKSLKIKGAALRAPTDPDGRQSETAFFTPIELLLDACPHLKPSLECPYRGLNIFTESKEHAKFFFGRDAFIKKMLEKLKQQNTRFLTVLGPSGSGKSSVVQAGLISQLRKGAIDNSDQWGMIIIRPTDNPFKQLADKGLTIEGQDLTKAVRGWFAQYTEQKRLVLVIDQFEELLSMCTDEICKDFAAELKHLLESPFPITIIAVMRIDFYIQFLQREILLDWLEQSQVNIPLTLSREEVTTIVEAPANAVGLRFQEGLVETIVDNTLEVASTSPDEEKGTLSTILPLLEFALTELWERRENGKMTREAFGMIGGVRGGLTRWADDAFFGLEDEEKQRKARRIFTDLVYVGNEEMGLHNSRLRVPVTSLYRSKYEVEEVNQIIQHLVQHHLLVTTLNPRSKQTIVEIIHDALIAQWGQLKSWLTKDREFLAWRQELEKDVHVWVQTAPDEIAQRAVYKLVRGEDLVKAIEYLKEHPAELTLDQRSFIRASEEQQERLEQIERAQKQGEIAQFQRGLLTRRTFLGGAIGGLVSLSVSFSGITWWEGTQNLHFFSPHGTLIYTYPGHYNAGTVWSVSWSPDSRRIASSDANRQVDMCDANDGKHVLQCVPSPQGAVKSVAWSPDGNHLASGSDDKTLRIWDTMGRLATAPYYGYGGDVHSVAWSPDGKYIASGCNDCRVYVWDIAKRSFLVCSHGDRVWQVVWSPGGKYFASACSDNTVQIWEASTAKQKMVYTEHTDEVYAVAWSPDGKYIASGGRDSVVRVWSADDGSTRFLYKGHTAMSPDGQRIAFAIVESISWSPDGQRIASGGGQDAQSPHDPEDTIPEDHTVQVWNAFGGNNTLYYTGHSERVCSVAWSPDGTRIASGGFDRFVQIWRPF